MRARLLGPLLAAAPLLGGCAAGQFYDAAAAIQTRNPHAAMEYAALCLQEDPEHRDAHILVGEKILKLIAMEHEAKVKAMVEAGNYEQAVADCDRVVASAYLARTLPGSNYQIFHEDHRAELAGQAAEKFYRLGERYRDEGDPKEAAKAFRRALGFRTSYRDARAQYDACVAAAKTYLYVACDARGADPEAVRVILEGIPRAARQRGLAFLEFVDEPGQANAVCRVRVEEAAHHDTGWQAREGSNEVWVTKRDPNTGQAIVDPKTGQALQEKKRGWWTEYSREVSYRFRVGFTVEPRRAGDPAPSGSAGASRSDAGRYAQWSGASAAVPLDVQSLPSSPSRLRSRRDLAVDSASACIDDLAHQLFLAYEK